MKYVRYSAVALLAVLAIASTATPSAAAVNEFIGRWITVGPARHGLVRMSIRMGFDGAMVRSWIRCGPRLCEVGNSPAIAFGPSPRTSARASALLLRVRYRTRSGRRVLIVRKAGPNRLQVLVLTRFTDGSGRANFARRYFMRRRGPGGPFTRAGTCVSFNPGTLRIHPIGGGFALATPSRRVINAFGSRFFEAMRGLQIIRFYGYNRRCTVGRPGARMVYWLRGAVAPTGPFPGEDCVRFNPDRTGIAFRGARWRIVEGGRSLFIVPSRREGLRALGVLRRYRFTRTCYVGRPPRASMSYLRR